MQELFRRVLELQLEYDRRPTAAMIERGELIRNAIPREMREWDAALPGAALPYDGELNVQGRDGTGLKTFVPWVRIHSPELSPSAQNGWYVVYLFRADGAGVYICLSHGSTAFDGFTFVPRPLAEMAPLMAWARNWLGEEAAASGFGTSLDLAADSGVALAYPQTTAFAKYYPRSSIPDDAVLQADAELAVKLLGRIYAATTEGVVPGMSASEERQAEAALSAVTRSGQGFGLTPKQRRAVETRAMEAAFEWLSGQNFSEIKDTSKNSPFDFVASLGGVQHIVEVKGTTGGCGSVILTKNEVKKHLDAYPNNLLIIVHGITLDRDIDAARDGKLHVLQPWRIEEERLAPLAYLYSTPEAI